MLEFRNPEDATMALALDGINMEADGANGSANGSSGGLKINRPQDYIAPTPPEEAEGQEGVSSVVNDSPNKIVVTQIPVFLTDDQVSELLTAFGPLKSFVLVKDMDSEQSRVSETNFDLG
jgi:splicing factor U2AF subunit